MELSAKLQIATILALVGVVVTTTMNTCAMDRLERQVIDTRKAVEEGGGSGGGRAVSQRSSSAAATRGAPGTGTGIEARGWGGTTAEVLFVEGAADDAPLTIGDKPLPQNDTYVNRRTSPPGSLNYYATNEGDASTISRFVLGRLMTVDPDAPPNVLPELATSWEVSEDKLSYTYHLRKGVQFADGRPFTSADVKFSFDVMRDPEVNAGHMRPEFDDVAELQTPDAYTVVVKYKRKYWKGLYAIGYTMRILNKGWYEEMIPKYAERLEIDAPSTEPGKPGFGEVFNKIRVPCPGTGPYYLPDEEYDPKKPIVLKQNPFYFGIQVHPTWQNFTKVSYIFISDAVAAFEEFRKEKFDVTTVDHNQWDDELSKDPSIAEIANHFEYDHMGLGFSYILWNTREAPFDDPKVRKAMTHLMNRQWVQEEIERGRGSVAVCPSKRAYPEYDNDLEPWPYDLAEAKRLLAEAGWTDTDGDGILDKDGKRFEFEFKVGSTRRFYTQVAATLEDACKQVGIRMTLRTLEWATFIEDLYERRYQSVALYASFADPWIDNYESFHSSQDVPRGGNHSGWSTPEGDKLLDAMREEFDADKRSAMGREFCGLFHEEQPMTLLTHGEVGVLAHKRLEGAKVRPTGLQTFDMWVKPENVLHK